MNAQREMTLDEYVAKLPEHHRAVQELADLRAERDEAVRTSQGERRDEVTLNRIMALVQTLGVAAHHSAPGRLWSDTNVAAAKDNLFNELTAVLGSGVQKHRSDCALAPELLAIDFARCTCRLAEAKGVAEPATLPHGNGLRRYGMHDKSCAFRVAVEAAPRLNATLAATAPRCDCGFAEALAGEMMLAGRLCKELMRFVTIDNGSCSVCHGHWLYENPHRPTINLWTGEHQADCSVHAIRAFLEAVIHTAGNPA